MQNDLYQKNVEFKNMTNEQFILGRDFEIDVLRSHFDKVLEGEFAKCSIRGDAGVGKTHLVTHFSKQMIDHNATYIHGKFKHYNNAMFSGITEVLKEIVEQTQTFSDERLSAVKKLVKKELGEDSHLIISICPEAEKLIGYYKKINEEDYHKLENRFMRAIYIFVEILSQELFPLIIHIDDIQWADHGSLRMLNHFCSNHNNINIYLILSSRAKIYNNDLREEIEKLFSSNDKSTIDIHIKSLNIKETKELLNLKFGNEVQDIEIISKYVFKATLGTPFYIEKLLDTAINEKKVTYNIRNQTWVFDTQFLESIQLPDDVKDMLSSQVKNLSSSDQRALEILACLGGQVDQKMLSKIANKDIQISIEQFDKLSKTSLLAKYVHGEEENSQYMFSHDIIFEMIRGLMSKQTREHYHFLIANILMNDEDKIYVDEQRVYIALQFLDCKELLLAEHDSSKYVLELYYAGRRAKQTTLIEEALQFYRLCIQLMPKASDSIAIDLLLDARIEHAECLFICGDVKQAENEFLALITEYEKNEDLVRIKRKFAVLYTYIGENRKVIDLSLEVLEHLDFKLKIDYPSIRVYKEVVESSIRFNNKKIKKMINMPNINDDKLLLIADTLIRLASIANLVDDNLFILVIMKLSNLSAKEGATKYALPSYAAYCFILLHYLSDKQKARDISDIVKELINNNENNQMKCMTYFILGTFLEHWQSSSDISLKYLDKSIEEGVKYGEYQYASYSFSSKIEMKYVAGKSFSEIEKDIRHVKMDDELLSEQEVIQLTVKLLEDHIAQLKTIPEKSLVEKDIENIDNSQRLTYYQYQIQRLVFVEDYKAAFELINKIKPLLGLYKGFILHADCLFYISIVQLNNYKVLKYSEKIVVKHQLKQAISQFEKWMKLSKDNHMARYLLVKAMYDSIVNKKNDAGITIEKAISHAMENNQIQLQALGNNIAGKYYEENKTVSNVYRKEAIQCYSDWGATQVAKQLEIRYNFENKKSDKVIDNHNAFNNVTRIDQIVKKHKSSHFKKIEELDRNQTFKYILNDLVASNKAGYGAIYLENNDQVFLTYQWSNGETEKLNEPMYIENVHNIPHKVMRYVVRTGKEIMIDQKPDEGIFVNDSYFRTSEDISLLCMPLKYMGVQSGILYLEWGHKKGYSEEIIEDIQNYIPILMAKNTTTQASNSKVIKVDSELTERECEVLILITDGLTNKQIGEQLCISLSTVKTHVINIYSKLNIKNRVEAADKARLLGLANKL